jgi:hypothetical protein
MTAVQGSTISSKNARNVHFQDKKWPEPLSHSLRRLREVPAEFAVLGRLMP